MQTWSGTITKVLSHAAIYICMKGLPDKQLDCQYENKCGHFCHSFLCRKYTQNFVTDVVFDKANERSGHATGAIKMECQGT